MIKSVFSECVDPRRARALTDEEGKLMLKVLIAERAKLMKPSKAADLFKNAPEEPPFVVKVMVKRLQLAEDDLEYSEGVIILMADLATTPARAVMLAHALVHETLKRGSCVDAMYFGSEIAPWGYPTDEMFREVWEAQKTREGNLLDKAEAWHG